MSYTLEVGVKVREGDAEKLLDYVKQFNQEGKDETGDADYDGVYDVSSPSSNWMVLHGDPYDLGAFMIRLFGQPIWQGGSCLPHWTAAPDGGENEFHPGILPEWDGTYDPQREVDADSMLDD